MYRILIADDSMFMRMTLRRILEKNGYKISAEAENGLQAVEKYIKYKPDLVTMDITMPIMEGIESVRKIMQIDKEAKIIMCSAVGQKSLVTAAIQAGAKDFIIKPFQSERVLSAIKKLLPQEKLLKKHLDNPLKNC